MVIAIIFILAGIIFFIGTLIYVKNKNSLQEIRKIDTKDTKKVRKTICNLWGITNIKNNMICVNKRQYSIILELETMEYNLLHDQEKNSVDLELIRISQMIKFPIQFLEIKQKVDTKDNIEKIELSTTNANSYIKEYGENLIKKLEEITNNRNLFNRQSYMIITTFNREREAQIELMEFYDSLKYHFANIKIGVRILGNDEVKQLIYDQLHKGSKTKVNEIIAKGGLQLYATQEKRKENQAIQKEKN